MSLSYLLRTEDEGDEDDEVTVVEDDEDELDPFFFLLGDCLIVTSAVDAAL